MNDRTWTLPGVQRVIAVASTPRTGSNLLSRALGATGTVPSPEEWMNPAAFDLFRPAWRAPRPLIHRRAVRRLGRTLRLDAVASVSRYSPTAVRRFVLDTVPSQTSADGTASLRAMWPHYCHGLVESGLGLDRLDAPVVWIRTTRRDRLQQAVSFARAKQSSQWTSEAGEPAVVQYDADLIDSGLDAIEMGERGWDQYFAGLGVTPIEVVYEDLDADYEVEMTRVLQRCGIDAPVPPRQLERQSDSTNAEWKARYRSERGLDRN